MPEPVDPKFKMPEGEFKQSFSGVTKAIGERQIRAIISTDSEDRDGDIVEIKGIDLTHYQHNPIVLFAHDARQPIARASDTAIKSNKLISTMDFPPSGVSAKADEILGLLKNEILNTTSIGFLPKKDGWQFRDMNEGWYGGVKFTATELMEYSVVSIPSNRDAVVIARSAGLKAGDFCSWINGGQGQIKEIGEDGQLVIVEWAQGAPTDSVVEFERKNVRPMKTLEISPPAPVETSCPDLEQGAIAARGQRLRSVEVAKSRAALLR